MEERLRFVARRLSGESMTALCREFGISRKTGHKIFARYRECGLEALADRPRRPGRVANRLAMPVETMIVALKREKPYWGARKLRELLARRLGPGVVVPARSTIHAVLDRHGLVEHARARRPRATGTPLSQAAAPNALWCTDFKGEFRLGDRRWCSPLTLTDQASRYLLMIEAFESIREAAVFTAFHRLFEERGLPAAIRSDVEPEVRLRRNGVPFADLEARRLQTIDNPFAAPRGGPEAERPCRLGFHTGLLTWRAVAMRQPRIASKATVRAPARTICRQGRPAAPPRRATPAPRSARGCHPCARYKLYPMCPDRTTRVNRPCIVVNAFRIPLQYQPLAKVRTRAQACALSRSCR
jgi:transposase